MAFRKTIILIFLVFLFSCHEKNDKIKELQDKVNYQEQLINNMSDDVFYMDDLINNIQDTLGIIDSLSVLLEFDAEYGTLNNINQADVIYNHINNLKNYLDESQKEIKKLNIRNKGLVNLIQRYQNELSKKETKIKNLEYRIAEKENIIVNQNNLISDSRYKNSNLEKEIDGLNDEIGELYYNIASEMENLANNLHEPRGLFVRKGKKEIRQFKKTLLKSAYNYYRKSYNYGYYESKSAYSRLRRNYSF